MKKQQIQNLLNNEEFMKEILPMKTPEEVQAKFKKEGVDISIEEVGILGSLINKSIEKNCEPLNEQELESIAGGNINLICDTPTDLTMLSGIITIVGGLLYFSGMASVGIAWAIDKYKSKK